MPADTCDVPDTSGVVNGGSGESPMRTESWDRHSSCAGGDTFAFETAVPVSVVIPCYRCAGTIARAVDSVFTQSCRPAELFLIDDCSADGTLETLFRLRDSYPQAWITVISLSQNKGPASARNAGWDAATQPYVAFLDADDSWHPEKLRMQYLLMSSNPDIVLCGHRCLHLQEGDQPPNIQEFYDATEIRARHLLFANAFSTPTVMLRRSLTFRFADGQRWAEDFFLWQRIACEGLRIVRLELPLAYIHKAVYGAGGLSGQLFEMEKGELHNLKWLYKAQKIGFFLYVLASGLSLAKFLKRLVLARIIS